MRYRIVELLAVPVLVLVAIKYALRRPMHEGF